MQKKAPKTTDAAISRFTTIDGIVIHFRRCGRQGAPVVLIHGGGSDHSIFSWKESIPALGRQFQIYAPDLPGYGRSEAPDWWMPGGAGRSIAETAGRMPILPRRPSINPLQFHIDFIGRFIEVMNLPKAAVVGISMGGAVALGTAIKYPRRVSRMVLVDSHGLGRRTPRHPLMFAGTWIPGVYEVSRYLLGRSTGMMRSGLRRLFCSREMVTLELIGEAQEALHAVGRHRSWRAFLLAEIGMNGFATNFLHELNKLPMETLLIHGTADRLVPARWAARAARRIPRATLELIENCGHLPPREQPLRFNQLLIDFLKQDAEIPRPARS